MKFSLLIIFSIVLLALNMNVCSAEDIAGPPVVFTKRDVKPPSYIYHKRMARPPCGPPLKLDSPRTVCK
ncbi:hypothetical protein pipiens_009044 [Culex pipiens pipiens]|uniref:Uncharacterized protein n=1 Tax=Culex pipiens pipiens TaxID=38569 RepID=A0ABD1DIX1_CULPP